METSINIVDFSVPLLTLDLTVKGFIDRNQGDWAKKGKSARTEEENNWDNLKKFIAQHDEDDCVIVSDHSNDFRTAFDQTYLLRCIYESVHYDAKILFGDAFGIGQIIPLTLDHNLAEFSMISAEYTLLYHSELLKILLEEE